MFLTEEELAELTGYIRPSAMRRWLDEHGYKYETDRAGWPKVMRTALCARLGDSEKPRPKVRLVS